MHILIAPNAFKNRLDASQVALAIEEGLKQSNLQCTAELFPIADGGDGTGSLIVEKCKGTRVQVQVHDPLGRMIGSSFGLIDKGKTAVIEMADASGLRLLRKEELNPMITSSYGTGELIKAALDKGANKIIIAMGGSATVDGGCGILSALGIKFLDKAGQQLKPAPQELIRMASVDDSGVDKKIGGCEIVILCDVNNKILGPDGAAAVFGPQKGATGEQVPLLEQFLENFAKISKQQTGRDMTVIKHGGAAGGATAGFYTWLNAKLVNGIEYFLQLTNFDEALNRSNLVITGEGSLDSQTLQGKGPYGVAVKAKEKGIKVIGLAGKIERSKELQAYFNELICVNEEPLDMTEAIKHTRENLTRVAKELGKMLTQHLK